jgi:hypothetical protein
MSNKALLSRAELEFTQKFQLHFPCGVISDKELEKWNGCKTDFLAKYIAEHFSKFPEPEVEPLIQFTDTVTIPACPERFVARDHFIVDTSKKAKVKISYLGDNFKEKFLDKIEQPRQETTLRYGKLLKSSVDEPIIAETGGAEKAETMFAETFALMEKQANGEAGVLLANGYANIFYIRDSAGVLWTVNVSWIDDGWDVYTYSVSNPPGWNAGNQVFARNSSKS